MPHYHRLISLLSIFVSLFHIVLPGPNDLHFHDGAMMADIIAEDVFFEILDPPELHYTYRIRPAKDFGATFNSSISFPNTKMVLADPLHSCTDIANYNDIAGNIALAERGDCSFVYKTRMAQEAGARALIITESISKWDEALDHMIEMIDDKLHDDVNIPAAFLLGRSGANIIKTLSNHHRNYAIVNLPVNLTNVPLTRVNQPPWVAW